MMMKTMFKAWLVLVSVFGLLVVVMTPAQAQAAGDLSVIIDALPPGFAVWIGVITTVLYALAQLRAFLPPSVTNRIPTLLMKLLDIVAANYKHAQNTPSASNEPVERRDRGPNDDAKYRQAVETAKTQGKVRGSSIENSSDTAGVNPAGSKEA
ncbi:hypothetical protein H2Y56_22060 [Pectobacterium aroidearum]|uniref:Uncharacterized protein n=2 Tax=Pectobacterium aroidearum TaxID=1201031 RepID=A0ABR5ZJL8_9GAMM|nr:hypothetical protein [Pectobacterium aroidearum]MBA5739948.1 hypothetical protein [Pectobacterium aroidearum]